MTKTTMKNESGGSVILKESTAGIFRKLTDLGNGQHYTVHSQLNQTYKEYWCIGNGSDECFLTLSSDDLLDYREILIKPINPNDPTKFIWEGIRRKQGTRTASTSSRTTSSRTTTTCTTTTTACTTTKPVPSSIWPNKFLSNKMLGCFSKQRPPGTVITSTATTNSATTSVVPPAATTTTTAIKITAPLTTTAVTPGTYVLATTP